jgi:hypothetical protein
MHKCAMPHWRLMRTTNQWPQSQSRATRTTSRGTHCAPHSSLSAGQHHSVMQKRMMLDWHSHAMHISRHRAHPHNELGVSAVSPTRGPSTPPCTMCMHRAGRQRTHANQQRRQYDSGPPPVTMHQGRQGPSIAQRHRVLKPRPQCCAEMCNAMSTHMCGHPAAATACHATNVSKGPTAHPGAPSMPPCTMCRAGRRHAHATRRCQRNQATSGDRCHPTTPPAEGNAPAHRRANWGRQQRQRV